MAKERLQGRRKGRTGDLQAVRRGMLRRARQQRDSCLLTPLSVFLKGKLRGGEFTEPAFRVGVSANYDIVKRVCVQHAGRERV